MKADNPNREIIESLLDAGTFRSPDVEYEYRSENFVARIPQTGETFDRDSLRAMQNAMGDPPAVKVERIVGEGDVWVVEAVNTYGEDEEFYVCNVVEFADGKICAETRYYAHPMEIAR